MHSSSGAEASCACATGCSGRVSPTDLLPSLEDTVYVGVSAGSIVSTPYDCDVEWYLEVMPPGSGMALRGRQAMGSVDFALWGAPR